MLKLNKKGQGFRVTRITSSGEPGEVVAELTTSPRFIVEFEIKIYDDRGLLFHVGREGSSDHWSREDMGFFILRDADGQVRVTQKRA